MSPGRAALLLVAVTAVLHLLVAGRFELSGDEAHYALYGTHLALSYFDHPPLVGWLQAVIERLSFSELALRFWPMLFSALSSLAVYQLARTLYPERSPWLAFAAVALLQSALMFQLLSLAMLPDTPLLPLGLAAAIALYRAAELGEERRWLELGLLLGLAGLAKYTAITLVLSVLLLLAVERRWSALRSRWLWGGVALAALLISPVIIWNFQHDWISFRYQLGHGSPDRAWQLRRLLLTQGGQLAAYGPAVYLFGLAAVAAALMRWREPRSRFLLVLALPPLLLFGWNSGYEPSLPHWTILGWALLAPLTAAWLLERWSRRWLRVAAGAAAVFSLLLTLLVHSELFRPWIPFAPHQYPLGDLYGWSMAAQRAETLRQAMAATPGPAPVIFAGNWSFASHIAWYAQPTPVQVTDDSVNQSDLWFGTPQPGARGILVVPWQFRNDIDGNGLGRFDRCQRQDELTLLLHNTPAASYTFYNCEGYHG